MNVKNKKIYLLFLLIFSTITGMENHHSALVNLPNGPVACIVHSCEDLYTVHNLLKSCKRFYNLYNSYSGTITEESSKKIFFGLDRGIKDNLRLIKSLSPTSHHQGLIHYAQQYNSSKDIRKKTLFYLLYANAIEEQQAIKTSLKSIFNITSTSECINAYLGKNLFANISDNKENIPIAIDIYLQNKHTSAVPLETLFFIAAENNIIPSVKKMITEYNLSVNTLNKHGKSALYIAVKHGYLDLIKYLLSLEEINPNIYNNYNTFLTQQRIHKISSRARINSILSLTHKTSLEILQLLLENIEVKANIDLWIYVTLESALQNNNITPIVSYLLTHKKLNLALYGGRILSVLLNKRLKYIYVNSIIALLSCSRGNQINVNFIHPDTKTSCLFEAVTYAAKISMNDEFNEYVTLKYIIQLLLSHKNIDPNIIYDGKVLTHWVCEGYGCKRTNYYDFKPQHTALYYAVIKQNIELVKFFLKHENINPNIICNIEYQETALHAGIRLGNTKIIKLLLGHPKTNPLITNKKVKTAYDLLHKSKNKEAIVHKKYSYKSIALSILTGTVCFWLIYNYKLLAFLNINRLKKQTFLKLKIEHLSSLALFFANC